MVVGMDNEEELIQGDIEGWVEIKEIMLKHFLPDQYQEVVRLKSIIKAY